MLGISEVDGNMRLQASAVSGASAWARGHFKCCGPGSREIFAEGRQIEASHSSSSTSLNLSRSSAHRSSF